MLPGCVDSIYFVVMDWTATRCIALFLGLWMALAPATSIAPATAMTLQMSMSSDASSGECDCCPVDASNNICAMACVNVFFFAATPLQSNLVPVVLHDDHSVKRDIVRSGHTLAPDPPPPRSVALR
jgi:hypothetical protein